MGTRRHNCSYIAETDVDLVSISHSNLKTLFQSQFEDVMQIVLKRFEKAKYAQFGLSMSKRPSANPDEYDSSDSETN